MSTISTTTTTTTTKKKVALCFIIRNSVNKEKIWREWIEPNKDIINVYFHCKYFSQIKSNWIKNFHIPPAYIAETSYFHVVRAYINLMKFAFENDQDNQWFCFLTESCVPILSPPKFRELFVENNQTSIVRVKPAWWNLQLNRRANLRLLHPDFHLANDPYFILKREDAEYCVKYCILNQDIFNTICKGIIANESIFAIILKVFGSLDKTINETTHITDWENMSSPTSPYVFKNGDKREIEYILQNKTKFSVFLRKVDVLFPDEVLRGLMQSR